MFMYGLKLGSPDDLLSFYSIYFGSHFAFFMGQWEEHQTHVLRSNLWGVLGVTEIQWINITMLLIPALSGYWLSSTLLQDCCPELVATAPWLAQKSLAQLFALTTLGGGAA